MASVLQQQIAETLAPGMHIPLPLERLFDWIEANGLYIDRNGRRIGFLYPESKLRAGWRKEQRPGGTIIEFFAEGSVNMKYWFGHERQDVLSRVCCVR